MRKLFVAYAINEVIQHFVASWTDDQKIETEKDPISETPSVSYGNIFLDPFADLSRKRVVEVITEDTIEEIERHIEKDKGLRQGTVVVINWKWIGFGS